MALKATIHKATVHIADMDRHYYHDHALTIARHPSETDERMMVRLLAFVCHADERLAFGKGLSTADEPDLWRHDLDGTIAQWIDVGLPDERRIAKACARATQIDVLAYGGRAGQMWWTQNAPQLRRFDRLRVQWLPDDAREGLAALAQRTMDLQCTRQDGQWWITGHDAHGADATVPVMLETLHPAL